jgi:gliding motility-associated-like protein
MRKFLFFISLFFIVLSKGYAQVEEIKLRMVYDTSDCSHVVWLHIVKGTANTLAQRKQFNAQISIVTPLNSTLTIDSSFNPTVNGVSPPWVKKQSSNYNSFTYFSIAPTLSLFGNVSSFENILSPGDSIKLFKLKITPTSSTTDCFEDIRLWRNNIIDGDPVSGGDPSSSVLPDGGQFDNGYTIGGGTQLYRGNFEEIKTPLNMNLKQGCNDGIEISLNLEKSKCQSPYTFQWTNPSGTTISTTENVQIPSSSNPPGGLYKVLVTDNFGCTQEKSILVSTPPSAGRDTSICTSVNQLILQGSNPTTGTWTSDPSNSGGANTTPLANGQLRVNFSTSSAGVYKYIYTGGTCSDTIEITRDEVDAGATPGINTCAKTASFNLNGVGAGTWTLKSKPAGASDPTITNQTIDKFDENIDGNYVFTWTVGKCTEEITLSVNRLSCACTIANTIDNTTKEFCGPSVNAVNLTGSPATPAGGTYLWEYSTDNGVNWLPAIGTNNNDTYSTGTLTVQKHYFRRLYTTSACSLVSNEVIIDVLPTPDAGPSVDDLCADEITGGKVNLQAVGNGEWSFVSTGSVAGVFPFIDSEFSPTTEVNNLTAEGTYIFKWKVGQCEDTIAVNVRFKPDAGPDIMFNCTDINNRVISLIDTSGNFKWSASNGNPTIVTRNSNFTNDSLILRNFSKEGFYTFYLGDNTCRDEVIIEVSDPADAGGPISLSCINKPVTFSAMATKGQGFWTKGNFPLGGSIELNDQFSATTDIRLLSVAGDYELIWRDKNLCLDTLKINVTTAPVVAGDFQTPCLDSSTLRGNTYNLFGSGNGVWTQVDANPRVNIQQPNNSSSTVKDFSTRGIYLFEWKSSLGGCADTIEVKVKVNPEVKPLVNLDCITLGNGEVSLDASGLAGQWDVRPASQALFNDDRDPKTKATKFFIPGTYFFQYTQNEDACFKEVSMQVTQKANAGNDDISLSCADFATAIGSLNAIGSGSWASLSSNPFPSNINSSLDPRSKVSAFGGEGQYGFVWTSNGCTDTAFINVVGKTDAGRDSTFDCVDIATFKTKLNAIGNGSWTSSPPGLTFSNPLDPQADVSNFKNSGTYQLIYNIKGCRDTTEIFLSPKANAGNNPPTQDCYSTASIILNAASSPNGAWVQDPTNPGTATILTPTSFSTVVDKFTKPGDYNFIWRTIDNCEDTVIVNLGTSKCACSIADNDFTLSTPNSYCKESDTIKIVGKNASPTGGTYLWQWSINGSAFVDAPGINNLKDFSITKQNIGAYKFRRLYSVTSGFACTDSFAAPAIVTVKTPPKAGGDYPINCLKLDGFAVTIFTTTPGTWTSLNGGLTIGDRNKASTIVTGIKQDGNYEIELEANGCKDTLVIRARGEAFAGRDSMLKCIQLPLTSFGLNANGTGAWSKLGTDTLFSLNNRNLANAEIANVTKQGQYSLLWTSTNACTDTLKINVTAAPNAGMDIQAKCISFPYSTTITSSIAGNWTSVLGAASIANSTQASTTVGPINFAGKYQFEIENTGCKDTIEVNVTGAVKATASSPSLSCYQTGSVVLLGNGTWTSSILNKSATIISTPSVTSVQNFSQAGKYTFILNKDGCIDSVTINVNSNCGCAITDNLIDPTSKIYCGNIDSINLTGLIASPNTGTYSWRVKKDNGSFIDLLGSDKDNTLKNVGPGTYEIQRLYTISTCADTSTLSLTINQPADAGRNIDTSCVTYPFSINASAKGKGIWTNNPSIFNTNDSSTLVTINSAGSNSFIWNVNGCIDTFKVNTSSGLDAGRDSVFNCVSSIVNTQLSSTGRGIWSQRLTNPSITTLQDSTKNITSVSGLVEGKYVYDFKNNLGCKDSISITVSKAADAGVPLNLNCVPSNTLTNVALNAVGTGKWRSLDAIFLSKNDDPRPTLLDLKKGGKYTFEWSTLAGCLDTAEVNISIKPDAGFDPFAVSCFTNGSTTITSDSDGEWVKIGSNTSDFSITNPFTKTSLVTFTKEGTYEIIRKNSDNCFDTVVVVANNSCNPCAVTKNIISPISPNYCNGIGNIRIDGLVPSGGGGTSFWIFSKDGVTYSGAPGSSTSFNYEETISSFGPGTYRFRRVFTSTTLSCSDTSNIALVVIDAVPASGGSKTVLCFSRDTAVMSAESGTNYRWEFVSATSTNKNFNIDDPTSPKAKISGFGGDGLFLFRWTNGICSSGVVITVGNLCNTVCNQNINNNIISPDTIFACEDGQNIYYSSPTANPFGGNYLWQTNFNNTQWLEAPPVNTLQDYKPRVLQVGNHQFRRLYYIGSCIDTSNVVNVFVLPPPPVPLITAPQACEGDNYKLSTPLVAGYKYEWRGPNGFISTLREPIIPNISSAANGEYSLYIVLQDCSSDTAKATITINKRPQQPTLITNLPICEGDNLLLKADKIANTTYTWTNPFNVVTNSDSIFIVKALSNTHGGTYILTADSANCPAVPLNIPVRIRSRPILSTNLTKVKCYILDSITLNVADTSQGVWRKANPTDNVTIGAGKNPIVKGFGDKGMFTFIWDNGACPDSITIEVQDNCNCKFPENIIVQPVEMFFCGKSDTTTILGKGLSNNLVEYKWQVTLDSVFTDAPGNNSGKDYAPGVLTNGLKFRRLITLKDEPTCTDTSNVVFINVLDQKSYNLILDTFSSPICIGDSIRINWKNAIPNVKYSWQVSEGLTIIDTVSNLSIAVIATEKGLQNVSLRINEKGCTQPFINEDIPVLGFPNIDLGQDTFICKNDNKLDNLILDAEGYTSVLWNDGSTDPQLFVRDTGTYSVAVKNSAGCESTDTISIQNFCCKITFPNVIKLNASKDVNKEWQVQLADCVLTAQLKIYDRWGNLMFVDNNNNLNTTNSKMETWNGKINGKEVEQGVYVFILEYEFINFQGQKSMSKISGDITVLR